MLAPVTRRAFLAGSAGAVAALSVAGVPRAAESAPPLPLPAGPVYGRTGPRGLAAGTAEAPWRGPVVLLDGRTVEVAHVHGRPIGGGKGVLIAPDGGGWSILYAEV